MSEVKEEERSAQTEVSEEEAAERIAAQEQGGGAVAGGERRPTQIPPELAKKLVKARSNVGRVAKNGSNSKFSYVRAEDVIDEAKKGLDEAGVIVLMEISKVETEVLAAQSGAPGKLLTVDFDVSVIDGESGEGYLQTWKGCGADYPGDKAIYKAQTGATKYFLASLLGIPFGDDPETVDGSGGSEGGGGKKEYPASDKQVEWGARLLNEAPLPEEAKEAVKVWIGGTEPKGNRVSRLIELLKPGNDRNPALLAKEAGWDGEIKTPVEPSNGQQEKTGAGSAPDPAHENDDRVIKLTEEISKKPGLGLNQVVELMKASGITPPEGDQVDRGAILNVLRKISDSDNEKLTQAIVRAREAKIAAQEATAEPDAAPAEEPVAEGSGTPDPEGNDLEGIDENSVLGQTVKLAESLGVDHLLEQMAELMYDIYLRDVPDAHLVTINSLLMKADQADITAPELGACLRRAIDNNPNVEERSEKFRGWIEGRLETKANTTEADKASDDAEGSQE